MPRLIAGDKTYEIGELTLGEFRLLKRRFDVQRMDLLDPRDPDHLVGLCVVSALRDDPTADVDGIVAELDALSRIEFEDDAAEDADDAPLDSEPSSPASPPSASVAAPAGSN